MLAMFLLSVNSLLSMFLGVLKAKQHQKCAHMRGTKCIQRRCTDMQSRGAMSCEIILPNIEAVSLCSSLFVIAPGEVLLASQVGGSLLRSGGDLPYSIELDYKSVRLHFISSSYSRSYCSALDNQCFALDSRCPLC